jgi:hypothetical protein
LPLGLYFLVRAVKHCDAHVDHVLGTEERSEESRPGLFRRGWRRHYFPMSPPRWVLGCPGPGQFPPIYCRITP